MFLLQKSQYRKIIPFFNVNSDSILMKKTLFVPEETDVFLIK